jgi:pyrophosphatase PpaX
MIAWICDVNGVLVDTVGLARAAFVATAAHGGFGFDEQDYRKVKDLSLLEAYRILEPGAEPSARQQFHLRYVRERIPEIRAYPYVAEILAAAKAEDICVGAATSHGETAEACLVHAGLYRHIDCLVTQEEVRRPKPHPDAILQILRLFNIDPWRRNGDRAVYIGDSRLDVEAGQSAGVRTIGVTYGVSDEAEIRAAGPDHVIHSFRDMRAFLEAPECLRLPGGNTDLIRRDP